MCDLALPLWAWVSVLGYRLQVWGMGVQISPLCEQAQSYVF